jgi:hypothetical protein
MGTGDEDCGDAGVKFFSREVCKSRHIVLWVKSLVHRQSIPKNNNPHNQKITAFKTNK